MVYRHIVLFRMRPDVLDSEMHAAIADIRSVMAPPISRTCSVMQSLDDRKGRMIIEDATFDDAAHFEAFRRSEAHRDLGVRMESLADWWVGDYNA